MVENSDKWSVGHTTEWAYKSRCEEGDNTVDNI